MLLRRGDAAKLRTPSAERWVAACHFRCSGSQWGSGESLEKRGSRNAVLSAESPALKYLSFKSMVFVRAWWSVRTQAQILALPLSGVTTDRLLNFSKPRVPPLKNGSNTSLVVVI